MFCAHDAVGFPWRFNPQTDRERIWAAQLIGIGALIVLLFVFVLVLTARSSRSFWGNLIGIWGSTTLAGTAGRGAASVDRLPDAVSERT